MAIDQERLLSAYQRLEKPLFNVLYRWLWNAADCEDVMQETFLRVFAVSARVHGDQLDALIYRTALNEAKNRRRWQRFKQFLALAPDDDATLLSAENPELVAEQSQLRKALEQLPADQRNVLLLSEFAGLSTDELADALNIAAGTVGSRKHRALQQLRILLAQGASS
ncbi:hypothetical protein C7S18_00325 [Ahniella affigens]|uniref:RNA polymerase subunit sigma-24 n=1 Tax=Ahniella affigens TaxID=2021234 RepID=A0A2P1PLM8_9GAMM|nr:sigma-70 family RNA polymerase sigma factor [Ahniella affigens]AVP95732.1 hypothetical protein C7S18_00325 [Ahniella affigens]